MAGFFISHYRPTSKANENKVEIESKCPMGLPNNPWV